MLSRIYKLLLKENRLLSGCLEKWAEEMRTEISPTMALCIWHWVHRSSVSGKIQEGGYKLVTRWYRTPQRLHRIFPSVSDRCWRCEREEGSLYHIFWTCPLIRPFWRKVWEIAQHLWGNNLELEPLLFLFHYSSIPRARYGRSVLVHLINAARVCIPTQWRERSPPTIGQWVRRINWTMRMEELSAYQRGKIEKFNQTWATWRAFQSSQEYCTMLSS